jgi:microcystin-dependent protein
MAYELRFTDFANKGSIIVEDRTLDILNTTLKFPGRGNTGFGQAVNENFLHLLENFANTSAPPRPVEGQLWYDSTPGVNQLKLYDGTGWTSASGLKKSDFEPAVSNSLAGDLWVNTDKQQLFLYTGAAWILVGPNFSDGLLTGTSSETIIGTDDTPYIVLTVKIEDKTAIIFSSDEFVPKAAIAGFRQGIKPGINISDRPLVNGKPLKYWGVAEKAENLIVDGNLVSANNFLRGNAVSTTNFQMRVRSNQGIEVGTGGQLRISIDKETAVFQHNTSGASINFRLREGNTTQTVLTIDSSSKVGINNPAPDEELDVRGNVSISLIPGNTDSGKLLVNSEESNSIITRGGVNIEKNLVVQGETFLQNDVTLTNILPDESRTRNIGSAANRFNQIFSDQFVGSFLGNVTGNVSGRSGSADRLTSATTFAVDGDVELDSFAFDGQSGGSTKTFDIRIRNSFIANKPSSQDANNGDEILINRTGSQAGIFKISKQNFLKTIPIMPVGSIVPYAGVEPPQGWLFCDGSEIRKSEFNELWITIRHRFKDPALVSDGGASFFALPDLRGRFPLGLDNMGGAQANRVTGAGVPGGAFAANTVGGTLGSETVDLEVRNLPQHDHNLRAPSGAQYYSIRVGADVPADAEAIEFPISPGFGGTQALASSGGVNTTGDLGRPVNVMNPYLALNYIIYTGTLR